ncbi:MAG: phosphoribosylformylglycinamidine synthase subunit PurS [Actinomycetota bacterium]|nr:phosphoribosylformylglycinamidine synthase subunit PurS [Actinomycetota bacterium]
MTFTARINVMPRHELADPEGQTIERALPRIGFDDVSDVRVGKRIELKLDASDESDARDKVREMCERMLANTVIESYEVEIQ